jgi:centrosomal protein CEP135
VTSDGFLLSVYLLISESVANHHEAMSQAIMVADRNKQLEKELHDIDQMALAVEAECNSTVKENSVRVSKIQVRKIIFIDSHVSGQRRSAGCINQLMLCTGLLSC